MLSIDSSNFRSALIWVSAAPTLPFFGCFRVFVEVACLIRTFLGLILVSGMVANCSAVGKGKHVLVKAEDTANAVSKLNGLFSHVLAPNGAPISYRAVPLTPKAKFDPDSYYEYLSRKYGSPAFAAVRLDATTRDRSASPPFVPIDLTSLLTGQIAELALNADLKDKKKIELEEFLKARLLNQPDIYNATVLHHRDQNGRAVFYYYPRIAIEFSSSLLTTSPLDRFSFLGMAIRLRPSRIASQNGDKVRIINVAPKAPDIAEYTRGQLTTKNEVTAKSALGRTASDVSTLGENIAGDPVSTAEQEQRTRGSSFGADLAFTYSETYVNNLLDSIEARTVGLHEGGSVFIAEYRSIKNKRIGGTYTFDVMIEVPSNIMSCNPAVIPGCVGGTYTSEPITTSLVADFYLVGVVRHVHKRGFTGFFVKVPEPENDHTYQQAVFFAKQGVPIWQFTNEPFGGVDFLDENPFTLTVVTNREDARFVVKADSDDRILGSGKGTQAKITLKRGTNDVDASVEFLDVIVVNEKAGATRLRAKPFSFTVPKTSQGPGSQTVAGNYTP